MEEEDRKSWELLLIGTAVTFFAWLGGIFCLLTFGMFIIHVIGG